MNNSTFSHPLLMAKLLVRIGFGIALALIGVAHYQNAGMFAEAFGRGLGPLEPLGMLWGYILPALFVVGGVLIALGLYANVGSFLAGLGLISIPIVLVLKSVLSGLALEDMMPDATSAFLWILVYVSAVRACEEAPKKPASMIEKLAPKKLFATKKGKKK